MNYFGKFFPRGNFITFKLVYNEQKQKKWRQGRIIKGKKGKAPL